MLLWSKASFSFNFG